MSNIQITQTETPNIVVTVDRGVAGVGIESVTIVFQDPNYFLEFTYTDGTTELVQLPAIATGVISFNTRIGAVTLTSSDVTTALGYTPPTPTGTGASGTWNIAVSGNAANVTGVVALINGGTGATTQAGARTNLGLGTSAVLNAAVALGTATLDASGTVPLSQIPASIQGGLNYQGTWNASTNTPTLVSSVGSKGYYYAVSVAGSTNLNGITDWNIGDLAVYNGTAWEQIDNTDAVTSVNGYTGTVVLNQTDIAGTANSPVNTNITSMTGVTGGISSPDFIQFDTTYTTTLGVGQLGWDGNDTLSIGMKGGNVTQHIGEDQFFYIKATATITKGQVVMFTGALGASGIPTGAPASGVTDGSYIMGVAAESIANNGFGLVQTFGTLRNINTSGFADGDILWYNPAVAGGLTNVKPTAPNIKAQIAAVIFGGSAGGGSVLIRINAGSTLGGTDSNAQITTPSNGQVITYDGQNGYWKNTALTAGTAVSVTPSSTGVLTIANTAPDQIVSIAGSGTTTVSGTYPNFTVASADQFNGTVTSVGGTGTVNGITLSGTVTSSGNLTLGGTLSGVNLTTQVTGTLPVANGGTGITSLGAGVATFLGTPTSANLAAAVTNETGTGALVFGTSPTLTTPTITGGTVNPTTLQENGSPVVVQTDIGTAPNEIPLNQYLGNLAYQDAANIAGSITAGSINNTPIGSTTASTGAFTTVTASTVTASTGILFGTDTAAANTLDDYEEGTWTPTVVGSTTPGTQTYIWQKATYTKIGNRVLIDFELLVTKDAATAGSISITGLPFTANANSGIPLAFTVVVQNGVTFSGSDDTLVASIAQTTSVIAINTYPSTNNLLASDLASGFRIFGTMQYYV
jgi:hypothetical protein